MTSEVHPEGDILIRLDLATPDLAAMRARRQQQVAKARQWRRSSSLTNVKAVERLEAYGSTCWMDAVEYRAPALYLANLEYATQPELPYPGASAPESVDTPLHHADVSALFAAPRPGPSAGQTPALAA